MRNFQNFQHKMYHFFALCPAGTQYIYKTITPAKTATPTFENATNANPATPNNGIHFVGTIKSDLPSPMCCVPELGIPCSGWSLGVIVMWDSCSWEAGAGNGDAGRGLCVVIVGGLGIIGWDREVSRGIWGVVLFVASEVICGGRGG